MATQKADTRKTTSLLKKYLQNKYGVKFSITTDKYSMGSCLRVSYTCGPDQKTIENEVDRLKYGGFDSMTDCQTIEHKEVFIIDGWELEQQKSVHVKQDIPEQLFYELTKCLSDNRKFTDVPKLTDISQMNDYFPERFGNASTWSQMLYQMLRTRNFHTDDWENIKITGMEDDQSDSFNIIFTYEYKGETFKTKEVIEPEVESTPEIKESIKSKLCEMCHFSSGCQKCCDKCEDPCNSKQVCGVKNDFKDIDDRYKAWMNIKETETNNNLNKTTMNYTNTEGIEINEIDKVRITYKSGKTFTGTVTKIGEKSMTVMDSNDPKLVMFITEPTIEKLTDDKKPVEVKNLYLLFIEMLASDKIVTFPEKDLEIAKGIILTQKGEIALTKLKVQYEGGKYKGKTEDLVSVLGTIGKSMAKKSKATKPVDTPKTEEPKVAEKPKTEKKTEPKSETPTPKPKTSDSMNPIMEAIANVVDEKSFKIVLAEVAKKGIKFVGVKSKESEYTLSEFKKGNIYVTNIQNEKTYYSLPVRFAVHFTVKE